MRKSIAMSQQSLSTDVMCLYHLEWAACSMKMHNSFVIIRNLVTHILRLKNSFFVHEDSQLRKRILKGYKKHLF